MLRSSYRTRVLLCSVWALTGQQTRAQSGRGGGVHISAAAPADITNRPALNYKNVFGGSGLEHAVAVATDSAGNAYVTGNTNSANFPVKNAFQDHLGGTPLRVSNDDGKSWFVPALDGGVYSIAELPDRHGVTYAGTSSGLYSSTDQGRTWRLVSSLASVPVRDIVFGPGSPPAIFTCTDSGIYRSTDRGATWNAASQGLGNPLYPFCHLVASPGSQSTLFASFGGDLWRSMDSAASWTPVSTLRDYVLSIAFDSAHPERLYVVGLEGFYLSQDNGDTWTRSTGISGTSYLRQGLVANAEIIYAATGNGLFRSGDAGHTWTPTIITAPATAVVMDPNDSQTVYVNADHLYRSTNNGADWEVVFSPTQLAVQTLVVSSSTPPAIFIGSGLSGVVAGLSQNAFVTKFSPDGKILYSTYLGGSYLDSPTAIAVDKAGNAWVTGYTYSPDFPVTKGALQPQLPGPYRAFLAKIGPDGDSLLYATFLGGSAGDSASAMALDGEGSVYLTGWAGSPDFPVSASALQPQLEQGCASPPPNEWWIPPAPMVNGDAFVVKVSNDGTQLLYSTFLGGSCADIGLGIAVDASGNAYIAGTTNSPDFPTTRGSFQPSYRAGANTGFLAKLSADGATLVYATFIGGPADDTAYAVAVDRQGNAYVTGASYGIDALNLPAGVCTAVYGIAGTDFVATSGGPAYILELNPAATAAVFKNYLGFCASTGTSLAIDGEGHVWVSGDSGAVIAFAPWFESQGPLSSSVPTVHPFQAGGLGLGFIAELSSDGGTVLFSSLLDWQLGMTLDSLGNAYVVGASRSADFPKEVTYNSYTPESALLLRIDGSVPSKVTIEQPQTPAHIESRSLLGIPFIIAPGAEIVITGTGLGPNEAIGGQIDGGVLSTSVGGTTVYFDEIAAPLLSVQAQRVVCLAPFGLAGRATTTVRVVSGVSTSNTILMPVESTAAAILAVVNEDGGTNSADQPAAAGSVVSLFVSGTGQTDPPSVDGTINTTDYRRLGIAPTVLVNLNLNAEVLYAGPAPGQVAGITQINFRVPPIRAGQWPLLLIFGDIDSGDLEDVTLNVSAK